MSDTSQDPYEIEDRTILTAVEHKLIGSTVDREDMLRNPLKPQAVLDGRDPREVLTARLKQREIVSMQSGFFGLKPGKMPVVALNVLDAQSGNVASSEVKLTGIYDFYAEKITRDPIELAKHKLNDEGKRKLMTESQRPAGREGEVA